ncbi:GumC family protein [Rariglobus hedericola]|uniref:Polysaccharide biosynthesis tyrosine autokinase n=1 Tax=Rariglobus hedericola TaxID=2597822 RepID=A0A556QP09_9BACT|nr:polysaccharide biosynthesis tyrosine autokinase [Rariglobus hedericola]TSJ78371.1 polysaccharide biosynthesis tyrosine autokinase [Rariglobus hedericola]
MSSVQKPSSATKVSGRDEEIIERRTLRDYYIILRERLWIALPLALVISIGMAYYQSRATPLYRSAATLQIEKPEKVVTTVDVVDTGINSDIELNTYLQVIASAKMRNRVQESLTPQERQVLQRPYIKDLAPGATPPTGVDLGVMSVQSVRSTFLINIAVSHRDPDAAAILANRYIEQFIESLLENVSGGHDYAVKYLRDRATQLQEEARIAEQRLQDYMRAQNLVSLDNSTNIAQANLSSVNQALQGARLDRLAIAEQERLVERYQAEKRNLLEITAIAAYGSVPDLSKQLETLNRDHSLLAERYLERHPKVINVVNAIHVAQEQLDTAIRLSIADLKTSLERAVAREKTLEKEYAAQEKEQLRLRDLSIEYRSLENQAQVAKSNYSQILDRLSQATTSKYLEKIPVRPLDPALPAGKPYTPDLGRIARTAVGVGVLVFFGVAIGLSFIDDRIKSAWDIEHFIGANLLGIIPDLSSLKDSEKYKLVLDNKNTSGVEPFLGVYSSVKIHSKLDFPKSILVTSTIPGEGKTLISSNLAGSFARHGKSVLLIDCDLRRPMMHRHFELANEAGLITWYEKGASLDGDLTINPSLGITSIGENLSLLSSGGRSKSPTQLLESPIFGQLLEKLKKHYDLIVVDSPPLGAVTDSLLIAERVDEVIYVCRFNRAFRKHIRLYIKALRSGKNEILGVVLNGLSPRRIEYYSNYRYYRSYKKYYGTQD